MIEKAVGTGIELVGKAATGMETISMAADILKAGIEVAGAAYKAGKDIGNKFNEVKSEIKAQSSEVAGRKKDAQPSEVVGKEKMDAQPSEVAGKEKMDTQQAETEKISEETPNLEKTETINPERNELTSEQKEQIKNETHWSGEVIDNIRSMDEYEKVYKPADLYEQKVDGRTCLVKNIDMDYVSPKTGLSNREAMAKGASPLDAKMGEKLELHHMGQNYDAPLAELCENSEHGDGNDKILHDKNTESWRNDTQLKNQYQNVDRPNHWKERAEEV